jgi:hypothetical protein
VQFLDRSAVLLIRLQCERDPPLPELVEYQQILSFQRFYFALASKAAQMKRRSGPDLRIVASEPRGNAKLRQLQSRR